MVSGCISRNQDSNHGRNNSTIGKNKMVTVYSVITRMILVHITESMTGILMFRRRNNGENISDWDSNYNNYLLDTPGNSTGYPFLIPAMYNTSMFSRIRI